VRGYRVAVGVLWKPANGNETLQCEGASVQCQCGSCPRSWTSTRPRGGRGQGHARAVAFGRDVAVLAAASLASASARERSRAMGRGCRCGAAGVGEPWIEHALNREEGAIQSASRRCQAPCLHAVTTLAWSRRRPNAAKPCILSRPHSV